ncbi:MAG TPA: hypothetical protein VFO76_02885, partial [Candidatus Kapabacteria bacterium]|nr:hypothetical protein [Candidatus Kapabacteria bacterium]
MNIGRITLLMILATILTSQVAIGQLQWQEIGSFSSAPHTVYFTDELHGFVSLATVPNGSVNPALYMTVDGGITWKRSTVQYLNGGYGIQDILMFDSADGLACGHCSDGYSLWRTTDAGVNWLAIGDADSRLSVAIKKTKAG